MEIRWQHDDVRIAHLQTLLGDGVLADLLEKAFPKRTTLHVRTLTPGLSGAAVLHVRPEYISAQHPCVVKVGPVGDLSTEYERWREFVQPYLGHGEMPDVLSPPVVRGGHAAIVYKFFASRTLANLLGELAAQDDSIGVIDSIHKLLGIVHVWHQSQSSTYLDLIADEYPLNDPTLDQFEQYARQDHVWGEITRPEPSGTSGHTRRRP